MFDKLHGKFFSLYIGNLFYKVTFFYKKTFAEVIII